jgi:hypothetical protein
MSPPNFFAPKFPIKHQISDTKLEMKNIPKISKIQNGEKKSYAKLEFKLTKMSSLYSDCIEDLDIKFNYFNTKLQKIIKKKAKEISELIQNEETKSNNKIKQKSIKNSKIKAVLKLKQEISKQTMENCGQNSLIFEDSVNKIERKGFNKIFIRNFSNHSNLKQMIILHLNFEDFFKESSNLNPFLEKISGLFMVVLIVNTQNEILIDQDNLSFVNAIFTNDMDYGDSKMLDLDTIFSEMVEVENSLEYLIILNKIKFTPFDFEVGQPNIFDYDYFDGIFPKISKKHKFRIDTIYFQSSLFEFSNILFEKIIFLLENLTFIKENKIRNDFILLDQEKIYKSIKKMELKENYINQWHEITKALKKKLDLSNIKDMELMNEFFFLKKNVKKLTKKFNQKQLTTASLDLLKWFPTI